MSGGLVVSLARALPERVRAAASIHGAWLVRDTDDSPHLGLDAVQAELYFAWVDGDPTAPAETVPVMTAALDAAGVNYTIDTITDAVHGFAPAGPRYDRGCVGAALGARPRAPTPQRRLTATPIGRPVPNPRLRRDF